LIHVHCLSYLTPAENERKFALLTQEKQSQLAAGALSLRADHRRYFWRHPVQEHRHSFWAEPVYF